MTFSQRLRRGAKPFVMPAALTLAVVATTAMTGCGDSASDLEAAIKEFKDANQGFIPVAQAQEGELVYDEYRQQQYDALRVKLQDLQRSADTQVQKGAASLLMGEVELSAARLAKRDARVEGTTVVAATSTLSDFSDAVIRAANRANSFVADEADAISSMNEQVVTNEARLTDIRRQLRTLDQQIVEAKEDHETLRSQAMQFRSESQKLDQQAFIAEGDEKWSLLDQASSTRRESDATLAEANKVQAKIDRLAKDRLVADARRAAVAGELGQLESQIDSAQTREVIRRQNLDSARNDLQSATDALLRQAEDLIETYNAQVAVDIEAADAFAQQATGAYKQATNSIGGRTRSTMQLRELEAMMERLNVLSVWAGLNQAFSESYLLIRDTTIEAAPAGSLDSILELIDQLRTSNDEIRTKSEEVITAADELVQQLASGFGEDSVEGQAVRSHLASLNLYRGMLNDSRID